MVLAGESEAASDWHHSNHFSILHDINGELKTVFFTDVDVFALATWELQWENHTVLITAKLGTLGRNAGFHSLRYAEKAQDNANHFPKLNVPAAML